MSVRPRLLLSHLAVLLAGLLIGFWLKPAFSPDYRHGLAQSPREGEGRSRERPASAERKPIMPRENSLSEESIAGMDLPAVKKAADAARSVTGDAGRRLERLVFARWARLDPSGAWEEAVSRARRSSDAGPALEVLGIMAEGDPHGALQKAVALPTFGRRDAAVQTVLRTWARYSPQEAWAYVLQHDDLPGYWSAPGAVLAEIAETDPASAVRLGATLANSTMQENMLINLMPKWVATDPFAATTWANSQSDPRLRGNAMRYAYGAWADQQPDTAADSAASIADTQIRNAAFQGIFEKWLRKDLGSALARAESLGNRIESTVISNYIGNYADNMTNSELLDASRNLSGTLLKSYLESIVSNRAMRGQYSSATSLVNELPEGEVRRAALQNLAHSWAGSAPGSFLAWLEEWPPSHDRDGVISDGLRQTVRPENNPERQLAIATTITEPELRSSTLASLLTNWSLQHDSEAQQWLQAVSELTAAEKARLTKSVQEARVRMMSR